MSDFQMQCLFQSQLETRLHYLRRERENTSMQSTLAGMLGTAGIGIGTAAIVGGAAALGAGLLAGGLCLGLAALRLGKRHRDLDNEERQTILRIGVDANER